MFYNTRWNRRKSFLHWIVCLFLQKFMFSATSWVQKKWSYNFNINCQVTLWNLIGCSLTFVMFEIRDGIVENLFFTGKFAFFFKSLFSATSWVQKKRSYNFNNNCQVTLWNLISCSLTFVMFCKEEIGENLFPLEILPYSSKIYVFSNLLGPEEMVL